MLAPAFVESVSYVRIWALAFCKIASLSWLAAAAVSAGPPVTGLIPRRNANVAF